MTVPFIPFANPHAAFELRKEEILGAVVRSLDSGQYILGAEVEAFEKDFAAWLGLEHAAGCSIAHGRGYCGGNRTSGWGASACGY